MRWWVALAGLLALGFRGPEPSPALRVYVPNQMAASISVLDGTAYVSSHGRAAAAEVHAISGHDMESPRENGTLVVIDAISGKVEKVAEVRPYAAALGIARLP